jgi:hypothetical protein
VPFSFTVTALDAYGNVATGYLGTAAFTSSDPQGQLSGKYTFTAADAGSHTFSVTLKTAGTQAVTATDTNTSSITGSATVAVSAATATHFAISAPASATAGSAFGITVTALDPFNNVATGYTGTVHFGSSDGNASLPGDATLTGGTGSFSVTLRSAGAQTLTATDTAGSINGTSGPVAVSPFDFPLTAGPFTPPSPVAGTPIIDAALFHFTDTDPAPSTGDFVATVTWGDGTAGDNIHDPSTVEVVASGGGFDVLGSHTYLAGATGLAFVVEVKDVGGAAPVSASAFINVSPDAVIPGTDGPDTLTLTQTPGMAVGSVTYVLNGGAPVALSNISSFKFLGMGGDDSMTVSLANGAPLVVGNVSFDGGTGLNTLTVDAAGMPVRTPPGTVGVGGQAVGYVAVGQLFINNAAGVNASAGPDTKDRATAFVGLSAGERAVQALFLDALGRVGTRADLDQWASQLPAGATSLTQAVVSEIENSSEARDHLVRSWYLSYLGRPALNGEELPFVQFLSSGQSEEQVLSMLLGVGEFYTRAQALFPSGTADERFVQVLLLDLFNRTGTPDEVNQYVNLLPQVGRSGLAQVLLGSQEFRTIQFEGYYNALLHRPVTSADTLLNSLLASGMDILSARLIFETSPEYFTNG